MENRPRNNNNEEKTETAVEVPLRYGANDFWTWDIHDKSPEVGGCLFICSWLPSNSHSEIRVVDLSIVWTNQR